VTVDVTGDAAVNPSLNQLVSIHVGVKYKGVPKLDASVQSAGVDIGLYTIDRASDIVINRAVHCFAFCQTCTYLNSYVASTPCDQVRSGSPKVNFQEISRSCHPTYPLEAGAELKGDVVVGLREIYIALAVITRPPDGVLLAPLALAARRLRRLASLLEL